MICRKLSSTDKQCKQAEEAWEPSAWPAHNLWAFPVRQACSPWTASCCRESVSSALPLGWCWGSASWQCCQCSHLSTFSPPSPSVFNTTQTAYLHTVRTVVWKKYTVSLHMTRANVTFRKKSVHTHTHAHTHTRTRTHTRLTALFPGLPGGAGTRKVKPIWILLKQETVSGSGISWAICKSAPHSRQIATPAPHHSVFYRPDALPAAQPTVSKHWRHKGNSN